MVTTHYAEKCRALSVHYGCFHPSFPLYISSICCFSHLTPQYAQCEQVRISMCRVMVVWIGWGSCGWPGLALCEPVGLSHQLVSTHCTFLLYSQPRLPQLHRSGQNLKHLQHLQILTLFYGHQTFFPFFIVEERMWTRWKKNEQGYRIKQSLPYRWYIKNLHT